MDCVAPCETNAATKIGGKWSAKAFALALQYESAEDRTGADYIFGAGTWNINKNNALILTAGQQTRKTVGAAPSNDSMGYALAYNHNMSKMTNVYVGYGAVSNDLDYNAAAAQNQTGDWSMLTAGMRVKF